MITFLLSSQPEILVVSRVSLAFWEKLTFVIVPKLAPYSIFLQLKSSGVTNWESLLIMSDSESALFQIPPYFHYPNDH